MSVTCQEVSNLISDSAIHTAVLNPQGSKLLVRKLIPAAISSILYKRTDFDRSAFEIRKTNGTEYNVFSNKSNNFALKEIRYWIKGALHAFDKNYLRELYFIFTKPDKQTEVLESYKFKIKYFGDNNKSSTTKEDLARDVSFLLQSIQELDSVNVLSTKEFEPFILLTYYDDVTPKDYEPPYFAERDHAASTILHNISNSSNHFLYFGKVLTGFHFLKCHSKGNMMLFEISSNYTSTNKSIEGNQSAIEIESGTNRTSEIQDDDETIDLDENETALSPLKIQCPCGINTKFNKIELVKCGSCSVLQHTPCLNHLYSNTVPDDFICDDCNNISILSSKEIIAKQIKCTYWLALAYAYFNNVVPLDILSNANPTHRAAVLQQLRLSQIVMLVDSEYVLDMSHLERVILVREFSITSAINVPLPDSSKLEDGSDRSITLSRPVKKRKLN